MKVPESGSASALVALLAQKIVGQEAALKQIAPFIRMHEAGLAPTGRPIGVFLLLGPTGTGKSRTVEVLAEVLHQSQQQYLRVDCGEFSTDHEVAKLLGSPPGYVGHLETAPMLSNKRLKEVTSEGSDISLVLFDEIEKGAPALTRILLGVLDKATLTLGDNTNVSFEKSLIFFTSNLGATDMMKELKPTFGFEAGASRAADPALGAKLENIALTAVRKRFTPEFVNRIDAIVTYQPLSLESLTTILDHQIADLQKHIDTKFVPQSFTIDVSEAARAFLLQHGVSPQYGARELKRVIHRHLMQPLATLVVEGKAGSLRHVHVDIDSTGEKLTLTSTEGTAPRDAHAAGPAKLLLVDDNPKLLRLLKTVLEAAGWGVVTAESTADALALQAEHLPALALVDCILPDINGLELSRKMQTAQPGLHIIMMTGGQLSADEQEVCRKRRWVMLQKPFLTEDLVALVRSRLGVHLAARGASAR